MSHHFTAADFGGVAAAFGLFALVMVIPGYVVGALLPLFSFGRRTLVARVAIAICLSIAIVPIATYLWWWACAVAWCGFPFVVKRASVGPLSKQRVAVLAILAGWVVVGAACLVDLQIGNRLYVPVTSFDYMLRAAITSAVERTGVPPANPYFFDGHGFVLRYHYFWYMLCGFVGRMGGSLLSARIAVIAGTLWSGIGLVAVIALYTHLCGESRSRDKRMLIAVGLLSVTGLDIVPLVIRLLVSGRFDASSEWWNEPVLSWVNSVFWQPHSIAALVACVTGLLAAREKRLAGAFVAGAAFASAAGLSIYVTFVFAVFLIVWLLMLRGRSREIWVAGVVAIGLSAPYLLELFRGSGGTGTGSGGGAAWPIQFAVRSFYFAEALVGSGSAWKITLANLLALPLNYFLEFGFFFAAGILWWKRKRGSLEIALLVTSVLVCSFLRSNSIANNDLGWRGIIFAQFVLLIWASEMLGDGGLSLRRSASGAMLALGIAATAYDVTMLRIYPLLLDALNIPRYHWLAPDHRLGERTYALREVYERVGRELPRDAIVQQNPNAVPGDLFYGLYADRQTAVETSACGVVFGGDPTLCDSILNPVQGIFEGTGDVDAACDRLSISAVIVKDTDAAWRNRESWVWKKAPLFANHYGRAFLCAASP